MCYVEDIEITDFDSGVRHVLQKFQNLLFDAEHEANYGMGKFYTVEQCNKLAEKYADGVEVCEKYLEGKVCRSCLVDDLIRLELGDFLYRLEEYMEPELLCKLYGNDLLNDPDFDIEDNEAT
jgi:hypothetical protein